MDNSQAIVIVLSDPGRTERVLKLLLESEIRGATIIESMGMGQVLEGSVPVIASIRTLLTQQRHYNQTIFAVSKHPEKVDHAIKLISEEFDDFKEPCTGMIFVVPVVKAVGLGRKDSAADV
ncbi:MAG TPA: hypothetical protein DDW93_00305 [Firmicutes bacterium]|jgi:nitrogen regulatory protein PII|nr:hypothetical protein [Bacillota bacterium]